MTNNNILSYFRKDASTLLTLSAVAIALLLTSPMLFFNVLFQPVQAQTELTFKTPTPASGTYTTGKNALITFDAHGGTFTSPKTLDANGTFQITNRSSGQILSSGSIWRIEGDYLTNTDPNSGLERILFLTPVGKEAQVITTSCSNSASNDISLVNASNDADIGDFSGPVECSSSSQGGGTAHSMTAGTTTAQDGDGDSDGIPDSSDRCTHNSNTKCFKEVDTTNSTTTTSTSTNSSKSNLF